MPFLGSDAEVATLLAGNPDLGVDIEHVKGRLAQPKRQKYGAEPTVYNGHRYRSKAEARHAEELDLRKAAGEIRYWLYEVPFRLPGGAVHRVDWMLVLADGTVRWEETKGRDLAMGRLKRRQVSEIFGIHVEVVK